MKYKDDSYHTFRAVLDYADPIARHVFPAALVYGLLAWASVGDLRKAFESGLLEFIAGMGLPFSLGCAVLLCGLSVAVSKTNFTYNYISRFAAYWSTFTISLAATVLGVAAGIFIPYVFLNGFPQALVFLFYALIVGLSYSWLAHQAGILACSEWLGSSKWFKRFAGVVMLALGASIAFISIYKRWVEIGDF